jgi:hypothetical protein
MSEAIQVTSTAGITLSECHSEGCQSSAVLWNLIAAAASTSTTLLVQVKPARPFQVILATASLDSSLRGSAKTPLQPGKFYRISLPAALFSDHADPVPLASEAIELDFSVCEVIFDPVPTSTLQVNVPSPFYTKTSFTARRFGVLMNPGAVKDSRNILSEQIGMFSFSHDNTPPVLDVMASNPSKGAAAHVYDNIVLTFNEVVQAGSGVFEIRQVGLSLQPSLSMFRGASSRKPS